MFKEGRNVEWKGGKEEDSQGHYIRKGVYWEEQKGKENKSINK